MKMGDHFALPVQWYDWRLVWMQEGDQDKAAAHAINCHDELVEALEGVLRIVEEVAKVIKPLQADPALAPARAILTKAKGE